MTGQTLEQVITSWYTDDARGSHLDFDDVPALVKRLEAFRQPTDPTVQVPESLPTREEITPLPDDARMDAYYYGFERTGVGFIDAILSAVAIAGKGSHHTESWGDPWEGTEYYFRGRPGLPDADSAVDLIQKAAQQAADAVLALLQKGGDDTHAVSDDYWDEADRD